MSQKDKPENNIYKAYTLVWVKLSYGLISKLESLNDYASIQKYFTIFESMKHIKVIIFKHEEQEYSQAYAYNAYRRF